jgi:toxin ParE1/3/4
MKVVLTEAARDDLQTISDWIAVGSIALALTFVETLLARCADLAIHPRAYPLIPRYEAYGVRRRPYGDYLIFYRVEDERVLILHILHGARDYEVLLFP